jgi:dTDP-4-amino-4,6-dideoxygalactose transaminase
MQIPFNRTHRTGLELQFLSACLDTGQTAGDSTFTKKVHHWLQENLRCQKALLTPSCTDALEMTALLLRLQPGDEVILPSFTFVSTANAYALFGASLVFADVHPETLTLDIEQVRRLITPRTKAIVIVHYAGITRDLDAFAQMAEERGITLIEDNAHGLLAKWRGRPLGTWGRAGTQSFHESKNFSSGEGGALILNDEEWAHRAEILREKGTNRSAFLRREVAKYTWVDLGSSYLASDLCAAALLAQLQCADRIQGRRQVIWDRYQRELADWAAANGVKQPTVPVDCEQSYHLYYLVFPQAEDRTRAIAYLRERDIEAYFHYLPLHLSDRGKEFAGQGTGAEGACPVTERASACLLRLPLYVDLSDAQQEYVIEVLREFRCG